MIDKVWDYAVKIKDKIKDKVKPPLKMAKNAIVHGFKKITNEQHDKPRDWYYEDLEKLNAEIKKEKRENKKVNSEARESFFDLREDMNNLQQRMLKINQIFNNNVSVIVDLIKFGNNKILEQEDDNVVREKQKDQEDKHMDEIVKEEEEILDNATKEMD